VNHPPPQQNAAAGSPLVEARNVYKTYRMGRVDVPVLRGVDLAVHPGECVAVLGASGSGKSTLLHLLGGLDRPDRRASGSGGDSPRQSGGEIRFRGEPLARRSARQLDRYRTRDVGFVFQFYHLLPELTVLENVAVAGMIGVGRLRYLSLRAGLRRRAAELLERFGLGQRLRHRPAELSGGERQRVAIARALINRPALLLADEPTGNLDATTGGAILDAIMGLRKETGQTMVIVTHDAATARRADRVVRLADGRVLPAEAEAEAEADVEASPGAAIPAA
jgi:ABC-type lipoprotein export system ATPase subunit